MKCGSRGLDRAVLSLLRFSARPYRRLTNRTASFIACTSVLILTAGCAWHYPITTHDALKPEAVHPSPERIAQLAVSDTKLQVASAAFLRLSSPVVLAGNAVKLSCFVPPTQDHRALRLALVDDLGQIAVSAKEVSTDELLIPAVACGSYLAICEDLANFGRVLSRQEQKLTSKGVCNQEDKDR